MQDIAPDALLSPRDHAVTPTVLVPVDSSDRDQRVIPVAAAYADLTDGELHLIRVLEIPPEMESPRARAMGLADATSEQRREMERSVADIAERLRTDTGRTVTAEVAEGFDVADVLIGSTTWRAADLVVMATRAPGAIRRALRGSVADRVMRESPRPVVLVPPGAEDLGGRRIHLRRVLVPLDGSELASAALDHLLELKGARELELVLLQVVSSGVVPEWAPDPLSLPAPAFFPDLAKAREDADHRLNQVADRLRTDGVKNVRVHVVVASRPAPEIARVAREEGADFIAMSTRGTSGAERFVLGSVAEAVVRHSDVPVLLVTPHDR